MASNIPEKAMTFTKNQYKKCKSIKASQEIASGSSQNVLMTQTLINNKFKNSPIKLYQINKTSLPEPSIVNGLDFQIPALPTYGVIGRDEDVKQIKEVLKTHQKVAICGMGGIGKTTLAIYCSKTWQKQAIEKSERLKELEEKADQSAETFEQENKYDRETIKEEVNEEEQEKQKYDRFENMSDKDCKEYEPIKKKAKIEEQNNEDEQQSITCGKKRPDEGEDMNKLAKLLKKDESIEEQTKKKLVINLDDQNDEIYFPNIAFLLADSRKNFESSIISLAQKLYINQKQHISEILKDIEKLYRSFKLLVILDNLVKLADIEELLEICRDTKTFYLLCTSQDIELDVHFCCYQLGLLPLKEGIYLMLSITHFATLAIEEQKKEEANRKSDKDKTNENEDTEEEEIDDEQENHNEEPRTSTPDFIVKLRELYLLVDGLPLSLAHAASWIEQNFKRKVRTCLLPRTTHSYVLLAEKYLDEFRSFVDKDFPEQFRTGISKSAFTALTLNIDKLSSSESKRFLYQLSFLRPDYIELDLFEPIVEEDVLEFALEELSKFSLISIERVARWNEENTILKIHRLTQDVSRSYLEIHKSDLAPLLLTVFCDIFSLTSHKKVIIDHIDEVSNLTTVLDLCPDEVLKLCVDKNFTRNKVGNHTLQIFEQLGLGLTDYENWPVPHKLLTILKIEEESTFYSIIHRIFRNFEEYRLATNEHNITLQHIASTFTNVEKFGFFKFLQDQGVDIHSTTIQGFSPLHLASAVFRTTPDQEEYIQNMNKYDQEDTPINQILSLGVDVNFPDLRGHSALHFAADLGMNHAIQTLLDVPGINVDLESVNGHTPLFLSAVHPPTEASEDDVIILSLLEAGAKADLTFDGGNNLLHRAVECKYEDVIKHILSEKLIDVNSINNDGDTPLHLVVADDNWRCRRVMNSVVKSFIQSGADLQLKNHKGDTPLDVAKNVGNRKIIKFLEKPEWALKIASEEEESDYSDNSNNDETENSSS